MISLYNNHSEPAPNNHATIHSLQSPQGVRVDQAGDETPEKWVQSACVLCSNGCGLDIGVKDGKVVGVRGREVDRVNKGRLGPKGLYGWKSINSPDRLTHPLVRKNGKLERSTWDEAMDLIVRNSKRLMETMTKHSIAFYTSGQLFLEEYYALALVGKGGLNTLHMDGNTRLCTATAAASMRESFGSDGQPGSYADLDVTDCLFLVGHNMAATQTVLWSRVLDRLEGPEPPQIVVVDPRLSDTAKKATIHLAPKIGTNLALLNGLQRLLFENDWINHHFVRDHVCGLESLKDTVKDYTPDKVEQITGVPADLLYKAARIIGTSRTLMSTALQGVYQSWQVTAAATQINNINLLLGQIGRPGSGILQMNGQPTAQNNRETGCDGEFPGFRNHQNPAHMEELARIWNLDAIKVPHWNEPTHIESLLSFMDAGSIGMLWVNGTNPLVSLPNLERVRKTLTRPNLFLVVQDIFMTETADIADVVLPAAQWAEKTGCFTNVDRTVHLSHKAVDPPGEAKSDLDIFLDYSKRMDFRDKDGQPLLPWTTSEEVFKAWQKLSAGRPCDYTGMSYEKLTGGSGIQWPCNKQKPNGTERLFTDGKFFTDVDYCESFGHDLETGAPYSIDDYRALNPAGRAILKSCHYLPSLEEPDEDYPLRLSTGRKTHHFHTRTKTGRSEALQKACPDPEIVISEQDATQTGVGDGDFAVVKSRRGQVELKVKIGDITQGQVFIPFHFWYWDLTDGRARAANELTVERWDPVSKQPCFKSGSVRIEKIPQSSANGEVVIHTHELHSRSVHRAESKHLAEAAESRPDDPGERKQLRQLELWLGETYHSVIKLIDIYDHLLPDLLHDLEIEGGVQVLSRIATRMKDALEPCIGKYNEDEEFGKRGAGELAEFLFFKRPARIRKSGRPDYDTLEVLQSLHVFVAHVQGGMLALLPASQALWDKDFAAAVGLCIGEIKRTQAWIMQQLKVRSPQTLLVPTPPMA
ncbi:uncharacterized protein B0I36DRAFT_377740 [Microdochium trichocladiopsis]|uniref:4Fe-4S Mo/W bis-MGD-type domain-containing protein n=1 Tax=Microdochium trichocladiopsis TaxID=1682393 RepID=A0A9P8XVE7_9PEZI|nr:uncharacterized protein B0I36DRAFT_377740 [Microdochium trichocladiopsis]KAH7018595.1 hypothetical protein B0I36DRAFT_377740 [Microdochium trichocladiopsis]